jgi:prepilin-type N-terminal cleavage/methylation domain-containing protein
VVVMTNRRFQRGLTLIELLLAMTVAALVFAALDSIVMLGLQAQASSRQANELVYQARFALDKMAAKARSTAPKLLATPLPGTTGDWFSPTMYCLNSNRLLDTVVWDTTCTRGDVIANNVIAFFAQLPAGRGPVDEPAVTLSLTLQTGTAPAQVTLTTSVRLGGGAL